LRDCKICISVSKLAGNIHLKSSVYNLLACRPGKVAAGAAGETQPGFGADALDFEPQVYTAPQLGAETYSWVIVRL
jgi:hypothetical protein